MLILKIGCLSFLIQLSQITVILGLTRHYLGKCVVFHEDKEVMKYLEAYKRTPYYQLRNINLVCLVYISYSVSFNRILLP